MSVVIGLAVICLGSLLQSIASMVADELVKRRNANQMLADYLAKQPKGAVILDPKFLRELRGQAA